jgi:hypothetical protein
MTSLLPCCRLCIQIEVQLQDGGKQKLPDDRNGTHAVQLLGFIQLVHSTCWGSEGTNCLPDRNGMLWKLLPRGGVVESSGAPLYPRMEG